MAFFEDFFGGMPRGGMGGMGGAKSSEPVDTMKFYNILGVEKKADARTIKKAYFKLARIHHPDKGGDEEKFKEIQKAYDCLKDESKREIYDRYGEKGLESGGSPAPTSVFDLFGGGARRPRGPQKPEEIVQTVDLTLSDVFYGPEKYVMYKYLSASKKETCSTCGGRGFIMRNVRAGPGMIMQSRQTCPDCDGAGFIFPDKELKKANKTIRIPKGVKNGDKIKMMGEGHSLPNMDRGDFTVVSRVMKHRVFERLGADLAMKKQLTLKEALCGFEFKVPHVSGTTLTVKSAKGEIIRPDQLKRIDNWGLPQKGAYEVTGHLYIKFEVLFPVPKSVKPDDVKTMNKVLSKLTYPEEKVQKLTLGMGVRVTLVNLNTAQFNGKKGRCIKDEPVRGRWPIELDGGKRVAVPENCLKIIQSESATKKSKEMELEVDEENVTLTTVKGEPKTTPAAAKGSYDEDEEEDRGVECRHM
mmetsp:Transcript_2213/g.3193  ORF Transcript_2213/g.3193 Transcript_2213/m.3193 type:complete len:470 (-) Transcript_2213:197-1606(-)